MSFCTPTSADSKQFLHHHYIERNNIMNKISMRYGKALILASAITGALALGGCAHGPSNRQLGIGAGAVAGGAVGNMLFGGPVGTVGGAAAGALLGNELSSGGRGRR